MRYTSTFGLWAQSTWVRRDLDETGRRWMDSIKSPMTLTLEEVVAPCAFSFSIQTRTTFTGCIGDYAGMLYEMGTSAHRLSEGNP